MNNEQILMLAIKQVEAKGWKNTIPESFTHYMSDKIYTKTFFRQIIFDHGFAKAFWGEGQKEAVEGIYGEVAYEVPEWEYHLQQMVLEEEPIPYIEQFLDE